MNTSIKLNSPCEIINVHSLSPFVSKVQIKVCWVGDEPNRNGSVITKETALKMAQTLPGSPIVGFFNENKDDFEEHNRIIDISDGKWEVKDTTRPYGYIDSTAQVWFQDYLDGDTVHTYLVTEGYIWTGQYPETNRILVNGNNQSMELDENSLNGHWAIDDKTGMEFFIINDAIISKLCILGENNEPCFEGANITKFSLDDEFNHKITALMKEVRKLKGGSFSMDDNKEKVLEAQEEAKETEFAAAATDAEESDNKDPEANLDAQDQADESNDSEAQESEDESDDSADENLADEGVDSENTEADNSVEFSLDDFHNLQESYTSLETQFNELKEKYSALESSYNELVEFKATTERATKQAMIDSFYMLSDADKEDVQNNIDKYSVEQIEEKLSVICVRNKLDLSGSHTDSQETTFSLNENDDNESVPALVSALRKAKKND